MRISVVGVGAVGARVARQLVASPMVDEVVLSDAQPGIAEAVQRSLGDRVRVVDRWDADADVVVLATPRGEHVGPARGSVLAGRHVVSVGDNLRDVRALCGLDAVARSEGVTVAVGAGFVPGLSCVLARALGAGFDQVEEIHVAKLGTGGPACASQHHRALSSTALDWRDGWRRRPGGSGRELCWFPDPVAGHDCYRAALPDALVLVPAFPGVRRVTARMAATRRDRLTMQLPMMRRPHPEGLVGAARVEVRGRREDGAQDVAVVGVVERPGVAAAAVAATTAMWAAEGRLAPGAAGLAALVDSGAFLREVVDRGVTISRFEGLPLV